MKHLFIPTPTFERSYKRLKKKYVSIKTDLEGFQKEYNENPNIGSDLGNGFRKIRIAVKSKNKGKKGGARIITYDVCIKTDDKIVILVDIYDKSEVSTLENSKYEMALNEFVTLNKT